MMESDNMDQTRDMFLRLTECEALECDNSKLTFNRKSYEMSLSDSMRFGYGINHDKLRHKASYRRRCTCYTDKYTLLL